jgi:streptogramin lyase
VVPDPSGSGPDDAVIRLDPDTGEVAGDPVVVPGTPWSVGADGGEVWVGHSDFDGGINGLSQVDPETGELVGEPIELGFSPITMAFADRTAWIIDGDGGQVVRIETATGEIASIPFEEDAGLTGITVASDAVWVSNDVFDGPPTVVRIDPATNERVEEIPLEGEEVNCVRLPSEGRQECPSVNDVATLDDALWVTRGTADELERIDSESGSIGDPIGVGAFPDAVVAGASFVWVVNDDANSVSRVDPDSGDVDTIGAGERPAGISVGDSAVWVANESDTFVSRIALDGGGSSDDG